MSDQKTVISTTAAPPPLPQFVQAVKQNGLIFCSGSIGLDPSTNKIVEGSVKARTIQALRNLSAVLEAGGSSLDRVLKVNIFLTTMDNFATMNEGWDEVFGKGPKVARTCVAVHQLPFGTDVEIEMTAACDRDSKV